MWKLEKQATNDSFQKSHVLQCRAIKQQPLKHVFAFHNSKGAITSTTWMQRHMSCPCVNAMNTWSTSATALLHARCARCSLLVNQSSWSSWALSGAVSPSAALWELPSIAFLHQRTEQAPRSPDSVAQRRADSQHTPGRCDAGGRAEDGGHAYPLWMLDLLDCSAGTKSPGCDETLNKVRHTHAHTHTHNPWHIINGPVLLSNFAFATLRLRLRRSEARLLLLLELLSGGGWRALHSGSYAVRRGSEDSYTPISACRPCWETQTRWSDNAAADFINMFSLSDGRHRE